MHISVTAAAWIWLFLGALLMLAELVSPGFVIFFFGLGATTVAACKWLLPSLPISWQLALFSVFSIVYLVLLRRWIKGVFMGETESSQQLQSEYVGRIGKVVAATSADVPGRIVVGDAEWSAVSEQPIPEGTTVKVVQQKNLTFTVVAV